MIPLYDSKVKITLLLDKRNNMQFTLLRITSFIASILLFSPVDAREGGQEAISIKPANDFCNSAAKVFAWGSEIRFGLIGFPIGWELRFEYLANRIAADIPISLTFNTRSRVNTVIYSLGEDELVPGRSVDYLAPFFAHDPPSLKIAIGKANRTKSFTMEILLDDEGSALGAFGAIRTPKSLVTFENRAMFLLAQLFGVDLSDSELDDLTPFDRLQTVRGLVANAYACDDAKLD